MRSTRGGALVVAVITAAWVGCGNDSRRRSAFVASPATASSDVLPVEPGSDWAPVPSQGGPPLLTPPPAASTPRHWYVNDTVGNPLKTHSAAEEQLALAIMQTINAKRQGQGCGGQTGLRQLTLDPEATRAAKAHAEDMMGRAFLGLVTPEGLTTADRLRLLGATGFMAATEVVASTTAPKAPAQEVVQAWLMSAVGREKLLAAGFTHIGIGVAAPGGTPMGGAATQISAVLLQRGE